MGDSAQPACAVFQSAQRHPVDHAEQRLERNVQNRPSHRDRKQVGVARSWGEGEMASE